MKCHWSVMRVTNDDRNLLLSAATIVGKVVVVTVIFRVGLAVAAPSLSWAVSTAHQRRIQVHKYRDGAN